ncbi:MAG TPA: hypothetical protein DCP20_01610 [Coriobacteriia bacterium]|nr:MAG: hypothetical protein XD74_0858 [Actinobacteria bacterium 66_15]HAL29402.1 hypothetical protein [Coriobacteriia bacterium]
MMAFRRLFPRYIGGYQLPNLLESEDDWRRTYNLDVPDMDLEDLRVELSRVKRAYMTAYKLRLHVHTGEILASMRADEWLYHRGRTIERELLSRGKSRCS